MLTGNNTSAEYCKPNVSRYQPSFDLRKNIARVIAHYSMEAIGKGIMLDIYVDHEIPNYFHGYVNCFVEIFSKMLKICIASMDEGEITIRIQQESVHQTNNCKTALSVSMTTTDYNFSQEISGPANRSRLTSLADKKIPLANCSTLERIKHLCGYLAGNLTLQVLDENKTQFLFDCVMQQAHPSGRPHQH